ncbi:MAG: tryptophan 7-halogenase [Sneathiellales bacterium]|nr:tryptophan 7-halogenase [Sneathiellales bacterium]
MTKQVTDITIVGGGTAGWLTAAFLIRYLNFRAEGTKTRISLIESPNVPTIGVGEATIPSMPDLLKSLGVSEQEFFIKCNASFKLGVRFNNWNHDEHGNSLSFVHPFDGIGTQLGGQNPAYHFHKYGGPEGRPNLDDCLSVSVAAIRNKKGPKGLEHGDYEKHLNYAYHLDAGLFADFLRDISVERGVNHILDDVEGVDQDENGFISSLKLQRNGDHPVQLVIDCTGFKGVIIKEVLGVKFNDYSQYLLNDRALAVQIPHTDLESIEPCTNSTALGAGWVWRVPLFNRIGTGYVFSSRFRNDEEAVDEFKQHLGEEGTGTEPRIIPVRVGRMEKAWEKNCVAIGLSSGFIEPLESTAIYMIENFVKLLMLNFPDRDYPEALRNRFNDVTGSMVQDIRDFIILHYCTNNRQDSEYWKVAREEMKIPDSVSDLLEEYRHTLPVQTAFDQTFLFNHMSYLTVLFAKGFFKGIEFPAERFISKKDWDVRMDRFEKYEQDLLSKLPGHYELLKHFRGEVELPSSTPKGFAGMAGYGSGQPTVAFGGAGAFKANIQFANKKTDTQIDQNGGNIL